MLYPIVLHMYKVKTLHNNFIDRGMIKHYGGWNHMSISINNDLTWHVMDDSVPFFIRLRVDKKLYRVRKDIPLGIFESDISPFIIAQEHAVRRGIPKWYQGNVGRYIYYYGQRFLPFKLWPKTGDCVHGVTKLVNALDNRYPILYDDIATVGNVYSQIAKKIQKS